MDSSYYNFSPYSRSQEFIIGGEVVGMHYVDEKNKIYSARLYSDRNLPAAELRTYTDATFEGPARQPLKAFKHFTAYSDAFGFPDDLLSLVNQKVEDVSVWYAQLRWRRMVIRVESEVETGKREGAMVSFDCSYKKPRDLEPAIEFVKVLAANTKRISEQGKKYRSTLDEIGDLDRKEVLQADVDELLADIESKFAWLHAQGARVAQSVQVRFELKAATTPLKGVLHCHWQDASMQNFALRFEGDLPESEVVAELTPQESGVIGFFKTLGELKVGDAALDDAYKIAAGKHAKATILNIGEPLLGLAKNQGEVQIEEKSCALHVKCTKAELDEMLTHIARLWRKCAHHRMGLSESIDETAPLI